MARSKATWLALAAGLVSCAEPDPPPPEGAFIETVAGTGDAAFDGDGRQALETSLYAPVKVGFGSDGRPLIIDWNNHRVRQLLDDGRLLTVLGDGTEDNGDINVLAISFSVHHPLDLELSPDGELLFAGYHDPRLLKVDLSQKVRVVAGFGVNGNYGDGGPATLAWLNAPSGLAIGADGTCWISDELNHNIRKVRPDGMIERVAGTSTRGYSGDGGPALEANLAGPMRIEVDPHNGDLYFADSVNHVVRKIDAAGIITTVAGTGVAGFSGDGGPATSAELYRPIDLQLLDDGSLLIADSENHRIRSVSADGIIQTIIGNGQPGLAGDGGEPLEASLNTPWGITVDGEGRLWIADTLNHVVRRTSAETLQGARKR